MTRHRGTPSRIKGMHTQDQENVMALGISNILIGAVLCVFGIAQQRDAAGDFTSLAIGLVVAGTGAVGVGVYQMWRQRYMYE